MRILIISTLIPYPPTDGGRISIYYPLKHLAARGHDITLACLSEKTDDEAVRHLQSFCRVEVQLFSKKPTINGLVSFLFSPRSYNLGRFQNKDFESRLSALVRAHPFDVVEVALSSARFGLSLRRNFGLPVILRVHNVHWVNLARAGEHWKNPLIKLYLMDETRKVRREELSIVRQVDLNLTVSDHDAEVLRRQAPDLQCVTVPVGVEMSEFSGEHLVETPRTVLWMGSLDWLPNQDSFWWFFNAIVPQLVRRDPRVRVLVAGSNPPHKIVALRHPNVEILGYVDDLRGLMGRSEVCVVPLRVGSGIRLKLLEMFAASRAVVATSVGCEGLDVEDGNQLLIADNPADFADAVIRLLDDARLRIALGERARKHVERQYDWSRIAAQFEAAYLSVLSRGTQLIASGPPC